MQCVKPATGIRNVSEKARKIWTRTADPSHQYPGDHLRQQDRLGDRGSAGQYAKDDGPIKKATRIPRTQDRVTVRSTYCMLTEGSLLPG